MSDEQQTAKLVTAKSISGIARWVCGGVGVAGLGGGAVAVYQSGNQAGTVALLTIGAFAALFCLIGTVPLRWTIGNASFDMSETVGLVVSAMSSQLTPEQLRALAADLRLLVEGDERANQVTERLADGLASASQFESFAQTKLRDIATQLSWQYATEVAVARSVDVEGRSRFLRLDGRFNTTEDHFIAVDIKTSTRTNIVFSAVRRMQQAMELSPNEVQAGLIGLNGPVPKRVQDYLDGLDDLIGIVDLTADPRTLNNELRMLNARIVN